MLVDYMTGDRVTIVASGLPGVVTGLVVRGRPCNRCGGSTAEYEVSYWSDGDHYLSDFRTEELTADGGSERTEIVKKKPEKKP